MNGPEHYREAERLVEAERVAEAQVHAILALAAASVPLNGAEVPLDHEDWRRALGADQ